MLTIKIKTINCSKFNSLLNKYLATINKIKIAITLEKFNLKIKIGLNLL